MTRLITASYAGSCPGDEREPVPGTGWSLKQALAVRISQDSVSDSSDTDRIPGAKFRETGTVWGHFTMFNLREQDTAAIG